MNLKNVGSLNGSALQSGGSSGSVASDRVTRAGNVGPVASAGSVDDLQFSAVIQATVEELKRISEDLQRRVNVVAPALQFTVDESTERLVIKVTDRATNEVIRQIPSDEALQIDRQLDRYAQSLLLDGEA